MSSAVNQICIILAYAFRDIACEPDDKAVFTFKYNYIVLKFFLQLI